MSSVGSITRCIHDLECGQRREQATRELFDRFFGDLARHALKRLRLLQVTRAAIDEEDVAERAFTKVCRGIESGHLRLNSRVDLRRLLLAAAAREAIDQFRRGRREGRGVDGEVLPQVPDATLPPDLIVLAEEACRHLLAMLGEHDLQWVARWKLIGYTNEEIRMALGCSLASVERKLDRIRQRWSALVAVGPAKPGPRGASSPSRGESVVIYPEEPEELAT
jgi:DNA-directed RNA polymerase specialized sigma24 family protein